GEAARGVARASADPLLDEAVAGRRAGACAWDRRASVVHLADREIHSSLAVLGGRIAVEEPTVEEPGWCFARRGVPDVDAGAEPNGAAAALSDGPVAATGERGGAAV